eukprot:12806802-Alexandrium_andersonii.AAC.1
MSASLVGSEMCIRDRTQTRKHALATQNDMCVCEMEGDVPTQMQCSEGLDSCLLYTSDAADDM